MLAEERFAAILSLLAQRGAATVTELAEEIGTSESTIRRDLTILAQQGRLNKVHGGATVMEGEFISIERDVATKENINVREKDAIGRYAATQVQPDDFVFIDAGTTTLAMIEYLGNSRATFVTNGIMHARRMVQKGLNAFVAGGQLKFGTEAIVGGMALESLGRFNFTKVFIGVNGITPKQGFTTPDTEEALVKAKAMEQGYITYVLADSSKFGKVSAATIAKMEKACIITDFLPDKTYAQHAIIKEVDAI